jgi:hypothetical protein
MDSSPAAMSLPTQVTPPDDPDQSAALIIIDLPHPQAFGQGTLGVAKLPRFRMTVNTGAASMYEPSRRVSFRG